MSSDLIPRKQRFRVAEVAELLTISASVVYRLIRNGKLPADRFGKALVVTNADLRHYIESARVKPGARS